MALGIEVSALMMLLRIRAIYGNNFLITVILSTILTVETGINVWLIYHEGRESLITPKSTHIQLSSPQR